MSEEGVKGERQPCSRSGRRPFELVRFSMSTAVFVVNDWLRSSLDRGEGDSLASLAFVRVGDMAECVVAVIAETGPS
jgi:hypothetical protein